MVRQPASWMHMVVGLAGLALSTGGQACWEKIGRRYNINPYLLAAIAKTESNFNANAVRRNTNGTCDIGAIDESVRKPR